MRYLGAALAAAIVALAATSSSASTACTGNIAVDGIDHCDSWFASTSGNPSGGSTDPEDLFGDGMDWFQLPLAGTNLDSGSGGTITYGAFELTFGITGGTFGSSALDGTWSVNFWPAEADGDLAFVLKGGSGYVAYDMNQSGPTSGNWTSFNIPPVGDPTKPDISNFSVFAKGPKPPPFDNPPEPPLEPIPLPATGLLVLGGLGVLASMRRRKRAA